MLRALAITFVMLSHGFEYARHFISFTYYKWLVYDGVGIFFVLSGFLIGTILLKQMSRAPFTLSALFGFWVRRWYRTLPAYYFVLCILIACYVFVHHHLPPQWMRYFTFTQNFAGPHPLFFGEAWSLSVEEWFYVLVPLGFFALHSLSKTHKYHLLMFILAVILGVTIFRLVKVYKHDYFADMNFGQEVGKLVVTRLDAIMFGVLGAWLSIWKSLWWRKNDRLLFMAGLFVLSGSNALRNPFFIGYFHYTLSAVGTLCMLPLLSRLRSANPVVLRSVTFISVISYSMYLTNHMIVQRAILPKLFSMIRLDPADGAFSGGVAFMLFWALTIVFSYGLYVFVERPMLRLRNRVHPAGTDGHRPEMLKQSSLRN